MNTNEIIECNKIKSFESKFEIINTTTINGTFGHLNNFMATEYQFPEYGKIKIGDKEFTNKRFGELLDILNLQYFPEGYLQD